MDVNFATNLISGTSSGTLTADPDGSGLGDIAVSGTFSGTTCGAGLSGSITYADGGAADLLDVDFAGRTFGWDAEEVGGAAIGTYLPTGAPLAGLFSGEQASTKLWTKSALSPSQRRMTRPLTSAFLRRRR